jgi:hypothetical protein
MSCRIREGDGKEGTRTLFRLLLSLCTWPLALTQVVHGMARKSWKLCLT